MPRKILRERSFCFASLVETMLAFVVLTISYFCYSAHLHKKQFLYYRACLSSFQGRTLRCSLSETKYRLFIGNVPKGWSEDDFRKIIESTGPGAETIELIKVYVAIQS